MASNATAETVARTVSARRAELGITQEELARKAGLSLRLVSDLEAGRAQNIGLARLVSVLDLLGVSLNLAIDPVPTAAGREPYFEQRLAQERIASMVERRGLARR